jgi:periplasmic divalent cation tolerance protein
MVSDGPTAQGDEVLVILTNLPDQASARRLATALVDSRTAACVNVLSGCWSVYRWHGGIETAEEVPVLIKTTRGRYEALEQALRNHHPYELPEILAVPAVGGLPAWLDWVRTETRPA